MVVNNYSELIKVLEEENCPTFYVVNGRWYGRLVATQDDKALLLACDLHGVVHHCYTVNRYDTSDNRLEIVFDRESIDCLRNQLDYLGKLVMKEWSKYE